MTPKSSRVLIVDDQPANVQVLTEALGDEHELLVAGSGARALELAPSADLVLLGVATSNPDGLEVCRRLKAGEATRRIPVIFVTAVEPAGDPAQGLDAGAADYIMKPIHPLVVRARVRAHLELKAARDLLERLSAQDALTGIPNRRRFDDAVAKEWRRSMRGSHFLTLAVADIDHFKALNDRHGHAGGDTCLRAVAEALHRVCRRPGELVARYADEEFAFLLPDINAEGARAMASRVLGAVAAVEVPDLAAPGELSVSLGLVTLVPSPLNSLEHALRVAREGLHKAKKAGRGRALFHDLETGAGFEVLPGA